MDFVVAGLGFGALIVVIGFVIRDLGPLLWTRLGHGAYSKSDDDRNRWRELCHSIATILTFAGCAILIVTLAAVLIGVSDSIGEIAVAAIGIVAVLAMMAFVGLTVRDYREAAPLATQNSTNASGQTALFSSPLQKIAVHSDVASVRRVEKAVSNEAIQDEKGSAVLAASTPSAPTPKIEGPFDATTLLHSEFDEHDEPGTAEPPVVEVAPPEPDAGALEMKSSNSEAVQNNETKPVGQEPASELTPTEVGGAKTGVFRSKLLADIGSAEPSKQVNGSFASSLLAGVDKSEAPAEATYQSPLLANLAAEKEEVRGSTEEVTVEPETTAIDVDSLADEPEAAEHSETTETQKQQSPIQH